MVHEDKTMKLILRTRRRYRITITTLPDGTEEITIEPI
jgi:hypothetical protein